MPRFTADLALSFIRSDSKEVPELRGLRAKILTGSPDLRAEMCSGMPRPTGIVQHSAGERDEIGVTSTHDGFCLFEFGDETHGDDWHIGGSLDRASERHLIARSNRNLLRRGETAAGDVCGAASARFECLRESDGLLDGPAALRPVRARDTHCHRMVGGKGSAHDLEYFEREAHPVLERATILVVTPVRQG